MFSPLAYVSDASYDGLGSSRYLTHYFIKGHFPMPSEKKLGQPKPWLDPLPEAALNADRATEIQSALESLPDLSSADMAALATKVNQAVLMGQLTLKSNEAAALKTLSSKYIPDAPKQINLQAEVKTESVILGWLQDNDSLREGALRRGQEQLESITVLELSEGLNDGSD